MHQLTRTAFAAYLTRLAQLNSVHADDVNKTFTVSPSVQQKLETRMQESSEFLGRINVIGVTEQQGQKLGLGLSGPAASRTDTSQADRQTRDITTLDARGYACTKTDSDTHIGYAKLDAWAKFPDFQTRVANAIVQRQALDAICIGFNGTSIAANTNLAQNPLLQDVNKGWLQHLREDAPENVMASGSNEGKVRIGTAAGTDYKNLDAAVFDAVTLLDPWFQQDPGLVAILGRKLLHDKYFPLVNTAQAPTETLAADVVISQKRVGGLQAVSVPYFPDDAILVTTFDNLSRYYQTGARRRMVVENPKRDRIENFESSNDAYVVEDNGRAALIERIEIANA
jgi:P2 family phage major capsid protein